MARPDPYGSTSSSICARCYVPILSRCAILIQGMLALRGPKERVLVQKRVGLGFLKPDVGCTARGRGSTPRSPVARAARCPQRGEFLLAKVGPLAGSAEAERRGREERALFARRHLRESRHRAPTPRYRACSRGTRATWAWRIFSFCGGVLRGRGNVANRARSPRSPATGRPVPGGCRGCRRFVSSKEMIQRQPHRVNRFQRKLLEADCVSAPPPNPYAQARRCADPLFEISELDA